MTKRAKVIQELQAIIDKRMTDYPLKDRKQLFLELEKMAHDEFEGEQQEAFLEALYTAKTTQHIQMEIGIDKALAKIRGKSDEN